MRRLFWRTVYALEGRIVPALRVLLALTLVGWLSLVVAGATLSAAPRPAGSRVTPTATTLLSPTTPPPALTWARGFLHEFALLANVTTGAPRSTTPPSLPTSCTSSPLAAPTFLTTQLFVTPETEVSLSVLVYPAGFGALALAAAQAAITTCDDATLLDTTTTGVLYDTSDAAVLLLRAGDVVLDLVSSPEDSAFLESLASTLTSSLTSSLAPVCPVLDAPASAAFRNPADPQYQIDAKVLVLSPPASIARPSTSLLNQPLPLVTPPPVGSVTSPPTPPTPPTLSLTTDVRVPVADPVGPGCGWAFTGEVAPPAPAPTTNLQSEETTALTTLEAQWVQYPQAVTQYLEAKATYQADLTSYDDYRAVSR